MQLLLGMTLVKLTSILISCVVLTRLLLVQGGDISHMGTHFTLAFSTARDAVYDNDCLLYLTSEFNNDVIVTIRKPNDFNSQGDQVTVLAGDHVRYDVGASFMSHAGFNRNGIEITSSAPITVQAATLTLRSSDTALILPTAALGVEYVIMSYMYNDVEVDLNIIYGPSQFLVVAPYNFTTITVTFTTDDIPLENAFSLGTLNGRKLTFQLDQFEAMQIGSSVDLTGTHVESNFPVAVFAGNEFTAISSQRMADHLNEQLLPVISWGTDYIVTPVTSLNGSDVVRVLGNGTDTDVVITQEDGTEVLEHLNATNMYLEYELPSTSYCHVSAAHPISVTLFCKSYSAYQETGDNLGDPFMMIIPALSQGVHSFTFSEVIREEETYITNVNLVVITELRDLLLHNNVILDADWTEVDERYSMTSVRIENGAPRHYFYLETGLIVATLYGIQKQESYGMPITMQLDTYHGPTHYDENGDLIHIGVPAVGPPSVDADETTPGSDVTTTGDALNDRMLTTKNVLDMTTVQNNDNNQATTNQDDGTTLNIQDTTTVLNEGGLQPDDILTTAVETDQLQLTTNADNGLSHEGTMSHEGTTASSDSEDSTISSVTTQGSTDEELTTSNVLMVEFTTDGNTNMVTTPVIFGKTTVGEHITTANILVTTEDTEEMGTTPGDDTAVNIGETTVEQRATTGNDEHSDFTTADHGGEKSTANPSGQGTTTDPAWTRRDDMEAEVTTLMGGDGEEMTTTGDVTYTTDHHHANDVTTYSPVGDGMTTRTAVTTDDAVAGTDDAGLDTDVTTRSGTGGSEDHSASSEGSNDSAGGYTDTGNEGTSGYDSNTDDGNHLNERSTVDSNGGGSGCQSGDPSCGVPTDHTGNDGGGAGTSLQEPTQPTTVEARPPAEATTKPEVTTYNLTNNDTLSNETEFSIVTDRIPIDGAAVTTEAPSEIKFNNKYIILAGGIIIGIPVFVLLIILIGAIKGSIRKRKKRRTSISPLDVSKSKLKKSYAASSSNSSGVNNHSDKKQLFSKGTFDARNLE